MMTKIRAAVVDDEMPARYELTSILQEMENVDVVAEFSTGKSFLEFLKKDSIDVVFMDIEMPVMTGIQTVQAMERMSDEILSMPRVVFSTGFAQFAIQAFDLAVFDYILKPYTEERIRKTIARVKQNMEEQESNKQIGEIINSKNNFVLAIENKFIVLNPEKEIVLIKTLQGKLQFYTTRGILESKLLLKDVESRLSRSGFLRTNKSFLVNINMVKEIEPWFNDTYLLIMNHYEKEEVPVSRHYLKDFKTVMGIL
ncbi:MAG: response regulator transcription factor [Acidaminococcaceae bacterium]|nr:response regulator transcription factor [Acidaminococcaceae bacterium]MBQ6913829.1 response regulator transcription factor [Acidaminococcaceae bacterium]